MSTCTVLLLWFKCETTFGETRSPGFSESTGGIGGAGTPLFCLSGCRSMARRTESRQLDSPARRARGTTCLLNVPERPCKALLLGYQAAPVRPASCARWEGAPVVQYALAARAMCAFLLQLLDYCTNACALFALYNDERSFVCTVGCLALVPSLTSSS